MKDFLAVCCEAQKLDSKEEEKEEEEKEEGGGWRRLKSWTRAFRTESNSSA